MQLCCARARSRWVLWSWAQLRCKCIDASEVCMQSSFFFTKYKGEVCVFLQLSARPPALFAQEAISTARCGKLGKYNYTRSWRVFIETVVPSVSRLLCSEPISAAHRLETAFVRLDCRAQVGGMNANWVSDRSGLRGQFRPNCDGLADGSVKCPPRHIHFHGARRNGRIDCVPVCWRTGTAIGPNRPPLNWIHGQRVN